MKSAERATKSGRRHSLLLGLVAGLGLFAAKDAFANELSAKNPVVHMDMSFALYSRGSYAEALKEAKLALALEPNSDYSRSMLSKINRAIGSGNKRG